MLVLPSSSSLDWPSIGGSRNVWTCPPDNPTARIGSVGWSACVNRSEDSGRLQRFSNMAAINWLLDSNYCAVRRSYDAVEQLLFSQGWDFRQGCTPKFDKFCSCRGARQPPNGHNLIWPMLPLPRSPKPLRLRPHISCPYKHCLGIASSSLRTAASHLEALIDLEKRLFASCTPYWLCPSEHPGARPPSPNMMGNVKSLAASGLASIAGGIILSAKGASAHGHDMSKIEEGEYMSAEPIVR